MEIAIWLGLLVLFGILEAATVALVSLWFMAGSLAALIAALCGAGLPVQVGVFLAVSALLLACLRPLVRRYVTPRITATNADSVIGKVAVVTEAVDNIAAQGAVKVGGVVWTARSSTERPIPQALRFGWIGSKVSSFLSPRRRFPPCKRQYKNWR